MAGARQSLGDLSYFSNSEEPGRGSLLISLVRPLGWCWGSCSGSPARSPGGARAPEEGARTPRGSSSAGSPAGSPLLSFLPRTAWGRSAPLCPCPPGPRCKQRAPPGAHKQGTPSIRMIPEVLVRDLCRQNYYRKVFLSCYLVVFFQPESGI